MHFVGFSSERFRARQHQARTAKSRTTLATCSYWLMKMGHFDTLGLRDDSNACYAIRRYSHFAIPKYGWKIVMVVPVNWHLNWLELWQLPNHWSLLRMPCCMENSASGDDALRQHALRRRPPGIALAARQAKANWHANICKPREWKASKKNSQNRITSHVRWANSSSVLHHSVRSKPQRSRNMSAKSVKLQDTAFPSNALVNFLVLSTFSLVFTF